LMNLEGFRPGELAGEGLELEDRWILSRLARQISGLRRNLDNYDFNLAADGLYAFIWHDFCDWYLEMVKPRLYGEEKERKQLAQEVLHRVLVDTLKMLHPFIPYITEEIWQLLPHKEAESVAIAPFPKPKREWIDPEVERKMATLQQLISAIRTIRSEMNIPRQRRARALIRASDQGIEELVQESRVFFRELAGVYEFEVGRDVERPERAPRVILEGAEVFLPLEGLIDVAKERVRLARELEEARRALASSLRKLEDERFLKRAPQEIVEKEQAKAEELRERAERLKKNLQILGADEQ
ncbi:MAG: class I tRNA ligase family protein, partial [Candidatus Bipolaricaulia bacterium]